MKEVYIAAATVIGKKRVPQPSEDFKPIIIFTVDELQGNAVFLNIGEEIDNVRLYGHKGGEWIYVDDVQYFTYNLSRELFAAVVNGDYITDYTDDGTFAIGCSEEHYNEVRSRIKLLEYVQEVGSSAIISYLNIAASTIERLIFTDAGLYDFWPCNSLTYVDLQKNNLAVFEGVGGNITYLNLNSNANLTKITTEEFPELTKLECRHCALEEFTALPTLPKIKQLYIDDNHLSGKIYLESPALERIQIGDNEEVTELEIISGATQLKNVDAKNCTHLETISVPYDSLSELNLQNTGFFRISIVGAQKLKTVNVSKCIQLNSCELKQNPTLSNVKLDGCTALRSLNLANNALKEFDTTKTKVPALSNLYIYNNNNLSSLNVSGVVGRVLAYNCPFSNDEESAQAFADSLKTLESGQTSELQVNGTQYDLIAAAATAAGWTVINPNA